MAAYEEIQSDPTVWGKSVAVIQSFKCTTIPAYQQCDTVEDLETVARVEEDLLLERLYEIHPRWRDVEPWIVLRPFRDVQIIRERELKTGLSPLQRERLNRAVRRIAIRNAEHDTGAPQAVREPAVKFSKIIRVI